MQETDSLKINETCNKENLHKTRSDEN